MSTPFSNESRRLPSGGAAGEHSPALVPGSLDSAGAATAAPANPFPADPSGYFERFREAAFFPVRPEPMRLEKNGQPVPGYRAIVGPGENGKETIFSVVSEDYQLLLNEQAVEIGRRLFARVLGDTAAADLVLVDWGMPESRASFQADFTSRRLRFGVAGDGRWGRFLRVKNSYNKSCQVRFSIGVRRYYCGNNLLVEAGYSIVGDTFEDRHRRTIGEWLSDLEEREVTEEEVRPFDEDRIRAQLERIQSVPVPGDAFLAGLVRILGIAPPDSFGPLPPEARFEPGRRRPAPGQWRYWGALCRHLEGLTQKYRATQGDNAFALLNAATDYASDRRAPGMHVERLSGLQARCGRALQELSEPDARFEVSEEDLAAAWRLRNAARRHDHFSH